jgi:hypothetical protein
MVWVILIVVALAAFVYFEWRSRNKHFPQGFGTTSASPTS